MRPHVGAGGGGPSPRYDSTASPNRFWANAKAATTAIVPARFGKRCRMTTRVVLAPRLRAASTNSDRASTRVLVRITRANVVQPTSASGTLTGAVADAS